MLAETQTERLSTKLTVTVAGLNGAAELIVVGDSAATGSVKSHRVGCRGVDAFNNVNLTTCGPVGTDEPEKHCQYKRSMMKEDE